MKRTILFICIMYFTTSCQTAKNFHQQSYNSNNNTDRSIILQNSAISINNAAAQKPAIKNINKKRHKINKDQKNALLITETLSESDDLTDIIDDGLDKPEKLTMFDGPNAVDSLDDLNLDTPFKDEYNPLMCSDSIFYSAWTTQFNRQWLERYADQYSNDTKREQALTQARIDEFIRLAYPKIEKTGYDFPIEINPTVLAWIKYFTGPGRKNFVVWLERGKSLIPKMQKTLEEKGLPKDLVYLSMIESGYATKSLSSVGAVGLWQFMPATAREYGLKINTWLDERRDIVKSTKAATNYLSNLYTQFGSWHLAAASYNGGPGLIAKTLKNYGENSSFFELSSKKHINIETANYVPKIIAAMIIAKNPSIFGFNSGITPTINDTTSVPINRSIALKDLSKAIHVNTSVLQELNPQLRIGITPPISANNNESYNLIVPATKLDTVLANLNSIPNAPINHLIALKIKRNEKIIAFARRYKITVASLLTTNSYLTASSALHKGQIIYVSIPLGHNINKVKIFTHKQNKHTKQIKAKFKRMHKYS